ncbi:retropepsin-like aspartic protease [Paraglaciecola sp.]|uniref:retropepsin-like aspartic protease family protein n=1 Tax=Paraglaciecola sp. TaxID=1920173 RepID=UPI0030F43976
MKGKTVLWLICTLSLLLNVYFIYHQYLALSTVSPVSARTQTLPRPNVPLKLINQDRRPVTLSSAMPNEFQASDNSAQTNDNRAQLLNQATSLLAAEQFTELRLFLRDYLQQHPLDMDFLLLEAQLNVNTELLSDAIAHYYSLTKLPMTVSQAKVISDSISELTSNTINQLQRAYSWDTLAIFVEPLLQLEPQSRIYILALAEAYAQQNQFSLMENILASLDFDDPAATKIRQLASVVSADKTQENGEQTTHEKLTYNQATTTIKLQQIGDQYIVNGQLSGNSVALLIDTGASITALTRQYFDSLSNRYKVNFIGRFSVNTASGQVLAPMYQFSELKLNHAAVENISVVILPMRKINNVNGLLGMNFLREFDFKIDQRESLLLLKR